MHAQDYFEKSKEELEKLTARQLLALKKTTYKRITCSCGRDCGDDYISASEREYNKNLYRLRELVNEILPTREHVPNKIEAKAARQARAKRRF